MKPLCSKSLKTSVSNCNFDSVCTRARRAYGADLHVEDNDCAILHDLSMDEAAEQRCQSAKRERDRDGLRSDANSRPLIRDHHQPLLHRENLQRYYHGRKYTIVTATGPAVLLVRFYQQLSARLQHVLLMHLFISPIVTRCPGMCKVASFRTSPHSSQDSSLSAKQHNNPQGNSARLHSTPSNVTSAFSSALLAVRTADTVTSTSHMIASAVRYELPRIGKGC